MLLIDIVDVGASVRVKAPMSYSGGRMKLARQSEVGAKECSPLHNKTRASESVLSRNGKEERSVPQSVVLTLKAQIGPGPEFPIGSESLTVRTAPL